MRLSIDTKRKNTLLLVITCLALSFSRVSASPLFEDVTASAGLVYQQHIPRTTSNCLLIIDNMTMFCQSDRMTGGAAVGDVDGDGDLDLFVTRLDASDILFRNKGDGTFEDNSVNAGFSTQNIQSNAAAFADIDNDGDLDLYISTVGNANDPGNNRNYLYINDGTGTFTEEAVTRGASVSSNNFRRSMSISFGDYDNDGWLDLHVTEWGPSPTSHSRLLHNMGPSSPGHFEDVTISAGVSLEGVFAFGTSFTDLDQDGWQDLVISGDFGTSHLFWNNGDGTFLDGTVAAQVGLEENGMGSTLGDFDGDGDLDWFVSSIYDSGIIPSNEMGPFWGSSGNRLYSNNGNRTFSDTTDYAGVRNGHWGWGSAFFDYDNDADLDLVMTNGVQFPGMEFDLPFNADPMKMWENNGNGQMTEVSSSTGLTDTSSGKGLLVFDYDQDGDLDIFIVNNASQPRLYRNNGSTGDWLRVNTTGVVGNKQGLGAKITLQQTPSSAIQYREIGTSTHFLGQSELTAHFGLETGTDPVALLQIRWPGGRLQTLTNIPRNSNLTIIEETCLDTDSDGLCDSVDNCPAVSNSFQINTDSDTEGNLCDNDDDNDGLNDSEEIIQQTDPLNPDSDGDTLNDGVEVYTYGTNPKLRDTDLDGFDDNVEINASTNPDDINSYPPSPTHDGDINSDGLVNAGDIVLMMRFVSGITTPDSHQFIHADIAPQLNNIPTPDGQINSGDARALLQKVFSLSSF